VLVPVAIRWPGKVKPRIADELLISHVDVLPTLLAFLNIAAPDGFAGPRSVQADSERPGREMPDSVYAEGRLDQPGEWRMLVRGYDKLVIRPREDATRLYNLADDPGVRDRSSA